MIVVVAIRHDNQNNVYACIIFYQNHQLCLQMDEIHYYIKLIE